MEQRSLFGSIKQAPPRTEISSLVSLAKRRVDDGRSKYTPSHADGMPGYADLRSRIILTQQAVTNGKLIMDPSYKMVRTQDELHQALKGVRECKMLPWDSEFDSLEYMISQLIGLSFTDKTNDLHFYVPFLHCDTQRNLIENQLTYKQFVEVAGDVWNSEDIKKITHQYAGCDNVIFQVNTGVEVRGQHWDTLLFENAVDENTKDKSLKNLYAKYETGDEKESTFNELFGGMSFAFVPLDVAHIYGCKDSKMTDRVYEGQKKILSAPEYKKMLHHYITVEARQIEVVTGMHIRGVEINEEYANELKVEYTQLKEELKLTLDTYFKQEYKLDNINYNSPPQMDKILYDIMKLAPVGKKDNATGKLARGTGDDILEKLIEKNPKAKAIKNISLFRSTEKLLSTYIDGIPAVRSKKDNRVHGKLLSHGAATGRYSSNNPNLQNIPAHFNKNTGKDDSRIRQMFKPRDGYCWLSSDYSQIEPRILAVRSGDKDMIQAYIDGRDLYSLMASQVYAVPYEDCLESAGPDGKQRRSSVKSLLLGIMYGRQPKSIGEQIGISTKEAEAFIAKFFKTYPKIDAYIKDTIRNGKLLGYVTTMADRRRRLPNLNSPNEFMRAEAERQAVNASIQGSSADVTKKAMWVIHKNVELKQYDAHLVLTIHDEVVVECPLEVKEQVGKLVRELMIESCDLLSPYMPMRCDVEVYESGWACEDSYKLEL